MVFSVVGVLTLARFGCGVIVSDMPLDCVATCDVVFYSNDCAAGWVAAMVGCLLVAVI